MDAKLVFWTLALLNLTVIVALVTTAVRSMGLPLRSAFQLELRGRHLNRSETLDELGIETDDTLRVVPEVSAG